MPSWTSSCFTSLSLLPFLILLPQVRAHGYVAQVTIDGTVYPGNLPNAQPTPSIIRQINTIDPVKGASNAYLNCVNFKFCGKTGDGTNWPHNTGPLMTYMASCGNTTCDQYDSTYAEWFKIEETGLEPGNTTWYQQNIMNGQPANVTIPSTLQSGQYLIRHEIIALHLATTIGGAEFYPSCTQVNVGGSQVGMATASEEVTFPGGYSDTDPGIYDPIRLQYTHSVYLSRSAYRVVYHRDVNIRFGFVEFEHRDPASSPTSSSSPSASPLTSTVPAVCALRPQQAFAVHKRKRSITRVMAAWIRSIGS
ncbi:glycoside hydrolase family 61 protein [Chiua virens]|nr:glycoside hydrolase family 61 protein [Chiua virens]